MAKGRKRSDPKEHGLLEFMGFTGNTYHIRNLIAVAMVFPLIVLIMGLLIGVMFDGYDMGYYAEHTARWVTNGETPYITLPFDYPPLALIPMLIATVPMLIFTSALMFVIPFIGMMLLCNAGISVCTYYIGKKIYDDETKAYQAGLLTTLGLSSAYFVVTRLDPLPVFLMMLSIAYILYRDNMSKGYLISLLGIGTKLFPGVTLPFLMLYNRSKKSLKDQIVGCAEELRWLWILVLLPATIITLLFFRDALFNYIKLSVIKPESTYVNTPTYTLYTYLSWVTPSITFNTLSTIMYVIMAAGLIYVVYRAWNNEDQTPRSLVAYIACAMMIIVFCVSHRSPQYALWFTPLVALLVIDKIEAVWIFIIYQFVAYIEFPWGFNRLWVNDSYTMVIPAVVMFTVEFVLILYFIRFTAKDVV